MKIIVAGFAKTGTKTMASALRILGYKVYDFIENYECLNEQWLEIFRNDNEIEALRSMYQDVDAVTDFPCAFYWKQLSMAFPEAKVSLRLLTLINGYSK